MLQKIKDGVPDSFVLIWRYVRYHHAIPNLTAPKKFTEKVLHRMIFERHDWMHCLADKYRVRNYVSNRIGERYLPVLYCVTTDVDTMPFETLPNRFVVKPTHGSGWVEVVNDKETDDLGKLREVCKSWLAQSYYRQTREWVYKDIIPRIVCEELIDDGTEGVPADYKLWVFDGRVEIIFVAMGRYGTRSHFFADRSWKPLEAKLPTYSEVTRPAPRPPHLQEMIEAAEALAQNMDFVRVDFYDTPDKLVFGEMTLTPGGSFDTFEPASIDAHFGSFWKIRPENNHLFNLSRGRSPIHPQSENLVSPDFASEGWTAFTSR